jgi:cell division protein FtsW (lipid II flippase)
MAGSSTPESSKIRNVGALLIPGIFLLLALLKLFSQDYLAAGLWVCLGSSMVLLGLAQRRRWAFWVACAMIVLSLVFVYLKSKANRAAKQARPAAAANFR